MSSTFSMPANAKSISDGANGRHSLAIPHIHKIKITSDGQTEITAIVTTYLASEIKVGDWIQTESRVFRVECVKDVRRSRGDWSENQICKTPYTITLIVI